MCIIIKFIDVYFKFSKIKCYFLMKTIENKFINILSSWIAPVTRTLRRSGRFFFFQLKIGRILIYAILQTVNFSTYFCLILLNVVKRIGKELYNKSCHLKHEKFEMFQINRHKMQQYHSKSCYIIFTLDVFFLSSYI